MDFDASSCPVDSWMNDLRDLDPFGGKVFVDIGFNKGYNFAIWAYLWSSWLLINPKTWHNNLITVLNTSNTLNCGNCNDCESDTYTYNNQLLDLLDSIESSNKKQWLKQSTRPNRLIGFDLNDYNIQLVNNVYNKFKSIDYIDSELANRLHRQLDGNNNNQIDSKLNNKRKKKHSSNIDRYIQLSIYHAAITDNHIDKYIYAEKCKVGLEICKVVNIKPSNNLSTNVTNNPSNEIDRYSDMFTVVRQYSLDILSNDSSILPEIIRSRRLSNGVIIASYQIDILVIDAEGFDPIILQGGDNLFRNQLVRILIFENNNWCPWPRYSLYDIVQRFDSYNYDCFYEGTYRLWKLTNSWDELYEARRWSNVLCSRRDDPWRKLLDKYITTIDSLVTGVKTYNITTKPRNELIQVVNQLNNQQLQVYHNNNNNTNFSEMQ